MLDQARALFLAMLLLVGGAFPVRDCLGPDRVATAAAAEPDACCANSTERTQQEEHPGDPTDSDGCDCPFGCCPGIMPAAMPASARTVGAVHAQTAWEIAPERRVIERPRGGPERPPKL